MGLLNVRVKLLRPVSLADTVVLCLVVAFVYAFVGVAQVWTSPFRPSTSVDLSFPSLCRYAVLSLSRVGIAYLFSLLFTLVYGYAAAKSRRWEPFLISFLDILQSVPVLGFMPGLVLFFVHLFPHSNVGLELAAVFMIFSGQAWNMVFSFYSSLKAVPEEWRNMSDLFRLSPMQKLRRVELPFAANGLLWNSMLSVAGGWFFLMTIESFSLGDQSFRLPGIGSYMAVAHERGDWGAILAGIGAMFFLIILVDRVLWAPLVVWSDRFKYQAKRDEEAPRSVVLELLLKSDLLARYFDVVEGVREWVLQRWGGGTRWMRPRVPLKLQVRTEAWFRQALRTTLVVVALGVLGYGAVMAKRYLGQTPAAVWGDLLRATGLTFLRVFGAVILGSLWAIPLGVVIGTRPTWTRRLQPVVQIVAAFPFPMLFPLLVLGFQRWGIDLEYGAVWLLMLSSQWYILFNVISGASTIPASIIEMADGFRLQGFVYWRSVVLPAIFPSLVNGWVTAAGGAWNACIVAEWVKAGSVAATATGIGATITGAAESADYAILACGISLLVVTVVLINRFLWGWLYRQAETRFRWEE